MSSEYMDLNDDSDSSSSTNNDFNPNPEPTATTSYYGSTANNNRRQRTYTESSSALSDDENNHQRKHSISSEKSTSDSPNVHYSPLSVESRKDSVSSELAYNEYNQIYYSPPPVVYRKDSVSSEQAFGDSHPTYYSPPPISSRKDSVSSEQAFGDHPQQVFYSPMSRKDSTCSEQGFSDTHPTYSPSPTNSRKQSSSSEHGFGDNHASYYSPPPVGFDSEHIAPTSTGEDSDQSEDQTSANEEKYQSDDRRARKKFSFYNNQNVEQQQSTSSSHVGMKRPYLDMGATNNDDDDDTLSEKKRSRRGPLESDMDSGISILSSSQSETSEPKLYSNVASKLMKSMGYQEGQGLGKMGQGRVEPVEAFQQSGRRGLGLKIPSLDVETYKWKSEEEVIELEESYTWLCGKHLAEISREELDTWKKVGKKKMTIDSETKFCSPKLLQNVLQCKSVFDEMEGHAFLKARDRANPFELIKNGLFLNRAAMKMANMDKRFDFMFTNPKLENGASQLTSDDLLYFADVCAGPGGFSEYVLYKKKWKCKGIGFTLKENHDFKLDDFYAGPSETFEPFYGVNKDGDVYNPENILSLYNHVQETTKGKGVHFMMADGGFSVKGQENIQEILSKRLYLCQFLVSLYIVRTGGHFVCKVFDMFTPFSAGLFYLLYRSYKQVCIFKPNTSRPANSERYVVCKWKRPDCDSIRDYLFTLNKILDNFGEISDSDIVSCVPHGVMKHDQNFFDYLVTSNNVIAERQIVNLAKVKAFYLDTTLEEPRQYELKEKSYELWGIPLSARTSGNNERPKDLFLEWFRGSPDWFKELKATSQMMRKVKDLDPFKYVLDWHYVVSGSPFERDKTPTLYLGLGKQKVFKYNSRTENWTPEEVHIQLSPGTLVYGEIVDEYQGYGAAQFKLKTFHIIDAFRLGDIDVSNLHYTERRKQCELFVESLYQRSNRDQNRIRMKQVFDLEQLPHLTNWIQLFKIKNNQTRLVIDMGDSFFAEASGIIFLKATKSPWFKSWSRTHRKTYFYNPMSKESVFEIVESACLNFQDCIESRRIWKWEYGCGMKGEGEASEEPILHKNVLIERVEQLLKEQKPK